MISYLTNLIIKIEACILYGFYFIFLVTHFYNILQKYWSMADQKLKKQTTSPSSQKAWEELKRLGKKVTKSMDLEQDCQSSCFSFSSAKQAQ